MPHLRCPECFTSTNVKNDDLASAECSYCSYSLSSYYYDNRSPDEAKKFIKQENSRLKSLMNKKVREGETVFDAGGLGNGQFTGPNGSTSVFSKLYYLRPSVGMADLITYATLFLSISLGLYFRDWYVFGGSFLGLSVLYFIPIVCLFHSVVICCLASAAVAAQAFYWQDGGYWITFADLPSKDFNGLLAQMDIIFSSDASKVLSAVFLIMMIGAHFFSFRDVRHVYQ